MKRPLLLLVVAGVAFAGAFGVRRLTAPETAAPSRVIPEAPRSAETAAEFSRAWSSAVSERNPLARAEGILQAVRKAGRQAMPGLAERYKDDPATLQLILYQWAALDPAAAMRWARDAVSLRHVSQQALEQTAEVWAARDPAALTAWLKEIPNIRCQALLLPKLTGVLFDRDPAAAFALAKEFPHRWSLPDSARHWVQANPALAAQTLAKLPLNDHSQQLAEEAAGAWAEKDGPAAAAWFAGLLRENNRSAASLLARALNRWSVQAPLAAVAFAGTLPPGSAFVYYPVEQWSKTDPAAALAWVSSQAHASDRGSLTHKIIKTAAEKDAAAAALLLNQMPEGRTRDVAMDALCDVWELKDPAAALSWFINQPAGPGRNESVASSVSAWAGQDPAAAAAWATSAPEGSLPAGVFGSIMTHLREDRAGAYAWLNELPPAAAREAANRFSGHKEEDFIAALALPDGVNKPLVVDSVANRFIRRSTDQAIALAATLAPAERDMLRGLVESAEPVPRALPNGNGLTAEKRAELLKLLR